MDNSINLIIWKLFHQANVILMQKVWKVLSSSRMRLAAAEGDFKTFRAGLPEGTPRKMAMTLFDTVRQNMNVQEMKEFLEYLGNCTKI